ncbi:hypothetical protein HYH03_008445 [Edaphochlamys debaryana]|uniref:Bifunctional inhibitor/plant lipid transfer protein/seed storage helical domain-containing protein n=1 Tax=Edaphochlamys debaryana TaxID=47281 RepID=A0A835Y6D8_9CHLO|nr:hypothetical protein HYH03_008445 [Edaphochlamys debaryana]|eukprot:KAG2493310.1 hypothetical protein HYH03_008445 [Edaphochlamys debaryana]
MPRRAPALALLGLLLAAALTGGPAPAAAQEPQCEMLKSILSFKDCAGAKPISADCCRKLLPFAQYYSCLSDPSLVAAANEFLAGVTTVDEAEKACLA